MIKVELEKNVTTPSNEAIVIDRTKHEDFPAPPQHLLQSEVGTVGHEGATTPSIIQYVVESTSEQDNRLCHINNANIESSQLLCGRVPPSTPVNGPSTLYAPGPAYDSVHSGVNEMNVNHPKFNNTLASKNGYDMQGDSHSVFNQQPEYGQVGHVQGNNFASGASACKPLGYDVSTPSRNSDNKCNGAQPAWNQVNQFQQYNNTPIQGTPYNNMPIQGTPYNNTPIQGTPYNNTPIQATPYNNTTETKHSEIYGTMSPGVPYQNDVFMNPPHQSVQPNQINGNMIATSQFQANGLPQQSHQGNEFYIPPYSDIQSPSTHPNYMYNMYPPLGYNQVSGHTFYPGTLANSGFHPLSQQMGHPGIPPNAINSFSMNPNSQYGNFSPMNYAGDLFAKKKPKGKSPGSSRPVGRPRKTSVAHPSQTQVPYTQYTQVPMAQSQAANGQKFIQQPLHKHFPNSRPQMYVYPKQPDQMLNSHGSFVGIEIERHNMAQKQGVHPAQAQKTPSSYAHQTSPSITPVCSNSSNVNSPASTLAAVTYGNTSSAACISNTSTFAHENSACSSSGQVISVANTLAPVYVTSTGPTVAPVTCATSYSATIHSTASNFVPLSSTASCSAPSSSDAVPFVSHTLTPDKVTRTPAQPSIAPEVCSEKVISRTPQCGEETFAKSNTDPASNSAPHKRSKMTSSSQSKPKRKHASAATKQTNNVEATGKEMSNNIVDMNTIQYIFDNLKEKTGKAKSQADVALLVLKQLGLNSLTVSEPIDQDLANNPPPVSPTNLAISPSELQSIIDFEESEQMRSNNQVDGEMKEVNINKGCANTEATNAKHPSKKSSNSRKRTSSHTKQKQEAAVSPSNAFEASATKRNRPDAEVKEIANMMQNLGSSLNETDAHEKNTEGQRRRKKRDNQNVKLQRNPDPEMTFHSRYTNGLRQQYHERVETEEYLFPDDMTHTDCILTVLIILHESEIMRNVLMKFVRREIENIPLDTKGRKIMWHYSSLVRTYCEGFIAKKCVKETIDPEMEDSFIRSMANYTGSVLPRSRLFGCIGDSEDDDRGRPLRQGEWSAEEKHKWLDILETETAHDNAHKNKWDFFAARIKSMGVYKSKKQCQNQLKVMNEVFETYRNKTGASGDLSPLKLRCVKIMSEKKHVVPEVLASSDGIQGDRNYSANIAMPKIDDLKRTKKEKKKKIPSVAEIRQMEVRTKLDGNSSTDEYDEETRYKPFITEAKSVRKISNPKEDISSFINQAMDTNENLKGFMSGMTDKLTEFVKTANAALVHKIKKEDEAD